MAQLMRQIRCLQIRSKGKESARPPVPEREETEVGKLVTHVFTRRRRDDVAGRWGSNPGTEVLAPT